MEDIEMSSLGTVTGRVFQRARAAGPPPARRRVSMGLVVGFVLAAAAIGFAVGWAVAHRPATPPPLAPTLSDEHEVGHALARPHFIEEASRHDVARLLDADARAARASEDLGVKVDPEVFLERLLAASLLVPPPPPAATATPTPTPAAK